MQAIKLAKEKFGPLTVAVNCAGIGIAMRTLSKKGAHPLNQFENVLKVNISLTHLLLELLPKNGFWSYSDSFLLSVWPKSTETCPNFA